MKKISLFILLSLSLAAVRATQPLPHQRVFQLNPPKVSNHALLINWAIAPGYFLYKDKLTVTSSPPEIITITQINTPKPLIKHQKNMGDYAVYRRDLTLKLHLKTSKPGKANLNIQYQGCADSGFCYPPASQKITLEFDNNLTLTDANIMAEIPERTDKKSIVRQLFHRPSTYLLMLILMACLLMLTLKSNQ